MTKPIIIFSILYAAMAMTASTVANAAETSPGEETAASALSQGRWVKFRVDTNGIHEFTHAELIALGFTSPEHVRVYGYPASDLADHNPENSPVDMPELASIHDGGKLLFYAEADTHLEYTPGKPRRTLSRIRNPYSTAGFYFLSDVEPQLGSEAVITEAATVADSDLPVRTDHVSYIFMEKDEQLPAEGGTYFLGASVTRSNPAAYEVTLYDPASAVLNFQITGGIAIGSSSLHNYLYAEFPSGSASTLPTDSDPSRCDVISAHKIQPYECFRACSYVGQCNLSNFDSSMTSATCRFNVIPSKTTFTFAAVDWVAVSYMRRNIMGNDTPALDMVIENPKAGEPISLTGAPSVCVWDITSSMHNVTSYTTDDSGIFALEAQDNDSIRHLIAFDPAKDQLKATVIEVTDNQNLHGMDCPDMLIITSSTFRQKAEDLAEIHREYQGIDVEVVDQQDIFNEFSSGTPHAMGVRRFVKMLSDRTLDKLKGVAMYGVASLHQSSLLNDDNVYVITAENEDPGDGTTSSDNTVDRYGNYDITRCFATDTYFVRTGATPEGLKFGSPFFRALCVPMTIVVGRIPVSSMASADAYNNKVRHYMANPPVVPAPNNSLFVSGFAERDEDMHMADSELQVNCAQKNRGAAHTSVRAAQNMFGEKFTDQTATTRMIAGQLQRGVGFFSYFGHGNNKGFSGLWDSMQAQNHNYTKAFPLGFFGSCNTAHFDSETNGFYVDMTFKENGGTIAMVASAREVYQNYNSEFGRIFADRYFKSADGDPLAKPYIDATNDITSTRNKSFICNTLSYCFIGDPMLPIYGASREVEISSLNGDELENNSLKPGRVNIFEGCILKDDGTVDSDFNGTVKISVYDHPYEAENRAKAVADSQRKPSTINTATFDQELLIEISGTVTYGIFTAEGIVPWPQRRGSDCRVSLYAYNDDRSIRGAGGYEAIAADYSSTEITDPGEYAMPEITSFELAGADEYTDREVSGNAPVRLSATINAPAGLSISDKFCNAAKLTHNGVSMSDAVNHIQAVSRGVYTLSYDIASPVDGRHDFTLCITDNLGNQANASLSFNARNHMQFELTADNQDSNGYIFTLAHSMISEATVKTVIIEDFSGTRIASVSAGDDGVAKWNLTDTKGNRVAPGHYHAYARVSTKSAHSSSPRLDLVVH